MAVIPFTQDSGLHKYGSIGGYARETLKMQCFFFFRKEDVMSVGQKQ